MGASSLLSSALAPSTAIFYGKSWAKFLGFCRSFSIPLPPAQQSTVVLFISSLASTSPPPSFATVASTISAISYHFKLTGIQDPCSSFVIKKILSGLSKAKPSSDPRLPLTPPLLQALIIAASKVSPSPFHQALFPAMFSLMFHAFLRIGEVTSSPHNLQFHQVTLTPSSVTLNFTSFKHSNGNPVMVSIPSSTSTVICPVRLLHSYLALCGVAPGPLFCYTNLDPVPPSYFRVFLNSSLTHAGLSQYRFTPHSFRIGAATYAASTGVPSEQIKVMGRWRSNAFNKYIRIQALSVKPSIV